MYGLNPTSTHTLCRQLPFRAGHKSQLSINSLTVDGSSQPPLFVTAIEDMKDVFMLEGKALGGTVIILACIIVKKGPVNKITTEGRRERGHTFEA